MDICLCNKSDQTILDEYILQVARIEKRIQFNPWNVGAIGKLLELEYIELIVILDTEHVVVSYCLYQTIFDSSEILRIGTDLSWQRKGMANMLLTNLYGILRNKSVQSILLEVREDNYPAIKFYQIQNFNIIDQRKGYYKTKSRILDGLVMQKILF